MHGSMQMQVLPLLLSLSLFLSSPLMPGDVGRVTVPNHWSGTQGPLGSEILAKQLRKWISSKSSAANKSADETMHFYTQTQFLLLLF